MKYLRKFSNPSAYESATLFYPSVSLIDSTKELMWDLPFSPSYVEIGGIKMATCNIGATKPEEYGLFFQWGDTQGYTADQVGREEGKKCFGWTDYIWGPSSSGPTKYNTTDNKTVLDLEDDTAHVAWGGKWRIPSYTELSTFGNAVDTAWTSDYNGTGISGRICTDKTDSTKTVFFPAAGRVNDITVKYINTRGLYWSNTIQISAFSPSSRSYGLQMYFDSSEMRWNYGGDTRAMGISVRAIWDDTLTV